MVSVPIYRGYVSKAKFAEGYALLGLILSAQKAYYSEYGNFYRRDASINPEDFMSIDPVLNIDARGNKYFSLFVPSTNVFDGSTNPQVSFTSYVTIPQELKENNGKNYLRIIYDVTVGTRANGAAGDGFLV